MVIVETENRISKNIQKTSPQRYKTQIQIPPFPGLANQVLNNPVQELRL